MNTNWKNLVGKNVKELRFILCNTTPKGLGMRYPIYPNNKIFIFKKETGSTETLWN